MKSKTSRTDASIATRSLTQWWKHLLLSSVLLIWPAMLPHPVLAHNPVLGQSTATNIVLDHFLLWTTIRQVHINVPDGGPTHNCAAIASADVKNPGGDGANQHYRFGIGLDSASPSSQTIRTIEMRDQAGVNDPDRWPVSTNRTFAVGPGDHTFYFLGGPAVDDGSNPDITVASSALTVICSHDVNP
jgi:hypothetical protein